MRITSKGQVTIPVELREKAGFLPETEVEFRLEEGEIVLSKADSRHKATRGDNLIRRMKGKGTVKMTTDEILALTR